MRIAPVALASLVSLCACSAEPSTSTVKITNGKIIAETARPEVVNLYRRLYANGQRQGAATCTGTWIGPTTILTAAHCTGDGASDSSGVVAGTEIVVFEITDHTTSPKKTKLVTTVVKATRSKLWEGEKGSNRYDLAVLETAAPTPGKGRVPWPRLVTRRRALARR